MRMHTPWARRAWTRWTAIALFSLVLGGCGGGMGEEDDSPAAEAQRYLQYLFGDPDTPSESGPHDGVGKHQRRPSAPDRR